MFTTQKAIFILALISNVCHAEMSQEQNLTNENVEYPSICRNGTILGEAACLPSNYLKEDAPERPTVIKTKMEIDNIREINDKEMKIMFELYLELIWADDRIIPLSTDKPVPLNNKIINKIWKPDLWIKNLYNFKIHTLLESTSGLMIIKENDCEDSTCDGSESQGKATVYYNLEAEVSVYCNFNFDGYPMDTQKCDFIMAGSYWLEDVVTFKYEMALFGETEKNVLLDAFDINMIFNPSSNSSELFYDSLSSTFILRRNIFPYILKYYLPAAAIVIMSSLSFLVTKDSNAIIGRMAIVVTLILTLTNILIAQQVLIFDNTINNGRNL